MYQKDADGPTTFSDWVKWSYQIRFGHNQTYTSLMKTGQVSQYDNNVVTIILFLQSKIL